MKATLFGTKRRVGFSLLALFFLILLFTFPILPPSIVVSSNDEIIYSKFIADESVPLDVSFTHSVNKGHIIERYTLDKSSMLISLDEAYFESYGAGMLDVSPDTDSMNFRQDEGYYVLDFPPQWKESIGYIGGDIARHSITYGTDVIAIGEKLPKQPFVLSLKSFYILEYIKMLIRQ